MIFFAHVIYRPHARAHPLTHRARNQQTQQHAKPLMSLLRDAFVQIATLLHRLEGEADGTLASSLVDELIAALACSDQSIHRQG